MVLSIYQSVNNPHSLTHTLSLSIQVISHPMTIVLTATARMAADTVAAAAIVTTAISLKAARRFPLRVEAILNLSPVNSLGSDPVKVKV